jgi:hypothetical protein
MSGFLFPLNLTRLMEVVDEIASVSEAARMVREHFIQSPEQVSMSTLRESLKFWPLSTSCIHGRRSRLLTEAVVRHECRGVSLADM